MVDLLVSEVRNATSLSELPRKTVLHYLGTAEKVADGRHFLLHKIVQGVMGRLDRGLASVDPKQFNARLKASAIPEFLDADLTISEAGYFSLMIEYVSLMVKQRAVQRFPKDLPVSVCKGYERCMQLFLKKHMDVNKGTEERFNIHTL
jgi:hypothetical protein